MNSCHQKMSVFTQKNQSSYYFCQLGETVRIKQGSVIACPQEIPGYCYYIRSGQVLAETISVNGEERVIFSFEKESIILAQYVLSGTKNPLSYRVKTEVLAQKISYLELVRGIKNSFHITNDNGETVLTMHVSQEMLGNMTGSHRVTVNRELKKLKEKNLIYSKERFYCIPDLNGLIAYRDSQIYL